MFLFQAKTSERSCDEPVGRDHALALPVTAPVTSEPLAALLLNLKNAPPHAAFIRNAISRNPVSYGRKSQRRAEAGTNDYPTKANRRKKCATVLNAFRTTQASGARSATEGLALSGTTPGEPLSVQRGARNDSTLVGRMIADSYPGFGPPNCSGGSNLAARSPFWSKEFAQ